MLNGGPILRLTPADVRPDDQVLVNGGWWTVTSTPQVALYDEWHLLVAAGDDEMTLWRHHDAVLSVDRPSHEGPHDGAPLLWDTAEWNDEP